MKTLFAVLFVAIAFTKSAHAQQVVKGASLYLTEQLRGYPNHSPDSATSLIQIQSERRTCLVLMEVPPLHQLVLDAGEYRIKDVNRVFRGTSYYRYKTDGIEIRNIKNGQTAKIGCLQDGYDSVVTKQDLERLPGVSVTIPVYEFR